MELMTPTLYGRGVVNNDPLDVRYRIVSSKGRLWPSGSFTNRYALLHTTIIDMFMFQLLPQIRASMPDAPSFGKLSYCLRDLA